MLPVGFYREAYFSFRSFPCILIKVSVGGKSSQTTRLLPFSSFVGTGLLTHTWVSESTKQRARRTQKNSTTPSFSSFPQPRLQKDKGAFIPASVPPPDTATNGLFHDISLLTSSSSHPELLTRFGRERSALLKDLQPHWKRLCGLCGSNYQDAV